MRKFLNFILAALVAFGIAGSAIAAASTTATPAGVVNLNTADTAQLSLLPRVGVKAAQRIVAPRRAREDGANKERHAPPHPPPEQHPAPPPRPPPPPPPPPRPAPRRGRGP